MQSFEAWVSWLELEDPFQGFMSEEAEKTTTLKFWKTFFLYVNAH